MAIPQGRFVWHDLMTSDLDAAKRFYGEVARWTSKPWDDDGEYTLWEREGVPVGGLGKLTNGAHPAWMPSVYVYDVDACARQAPKIGGKLIQPPREIPQVGGWAIVAGPEGAPIGIFEPTDEPPAPTGEAKTGEFSWHELLSNDWRVSWDFYRTLFRWEHVREFDMGANGTYMIFGLNGEGFGGMFTGTPDMPPPNWTSYVQVDSVAAAANAVQKLGGKIMRPPHQVPTGTWISIVEDPQGAMFALASAAQ